LNHLGEHVASPPVAREATQSYLRTIETVGAAGLPCKISVKLSQIGLELDPALCTDNLRQILTAARHQGGFVRLDMEGSGTVDATIEIFETVWHEGLRNVGVVLQAYLLRTERDLQRLLALGGRVRLCKGAYKEPEEVAYQDKADVDEAFLHLMRRLLTAGQAPAFATHDPRMIDETCRFAREQGIGAEGFEFQMLYGVRRDLQTALRDRGYGVRVYVPFGVEWFPYFMRRLAERPANVGFVIRSLVYEQMGKQSR
jgi:proline dehydrogenase